ncbi:MAG: hypothetical protein Kow0092_37820 [Deferrisomatales bacterium]
MFKPAGVPLRGLPQQVLYHDELEALVLCDEQGLTQEQAGERMGVSRGTIQRLVASGRKKLAGAVARSEVLVVRPLPGATRPPPGEEAGAGAPAGE